MSSLQREELKSYYKDLDNLMYSQEEENSISEQYLLQLNNIKSKIDKVFNSFQPNYEDTMKRADYILKVLDEIQPKESHPFKTFDQWLNSEGEMFRMFGMKGRMKFA